MQGERCPGVEQTPCLKKESLVYFVRRVWDGRPEGNQELMAGLLVMLIRDSDTSCLRDRSGGDHPPAE